jgi:phosphatidylglycerophosphate synthase
MKWRQFLEVAYPATMAKSEASRSLVYMTNRWIGLGFAYVFYHLRIPANVLSVMRLAVALAGLYLISYVTTGHKWQPLLGVLLLVWQVNLDFADGAVARAEGRTSRLGDKLDRLPNDASRAAVLLLAGFLANNTAVFLVSAFSVYVLITFIPDSGFQIKPFGKWQFLASVFRAVLFVPVVVVLIPLVFALHSFLDISTEATAWGVTFGYAGFAGLWLLLCLWSARAKDPPLQAYERP